MKLALLDSDCFACSSWWIWTITDALTSLRYARYMAMMANQIRLCHNDCPQLSVWHTAIGCVFTFMALSRQMDCSRQCDQDAEPEISKGLVQFIWCMCMSTVTLRLVLLYYVMLTCIVWCAISMYGEFKGKHVILQTNKENHCHKIPFLSGSMQDESCVLFSI